MTSLLDGPDGAASIKNYLEREALTKLDDLTKLETRAQYIKTLLEAKKTLRSKSERR